ncbi:MAG: dTDP-4-dehydrorhamnose 3,5-epimerase family protein [Paracoccaceae bacterium]|tara:strand:+ start:272 stop:802 length:531 start_codon:yes stop_codon:yes gene_type:complete
MLHKKIPLEGALEIDCLPKKDERGSFVRFFCQKSLSKLCKSTKIVQINSSYSRIAGTVRGLHFQSSPSQENKFIRCIRGKIFDVIVDLREESNTFGKLYSVILDSKKMNMIFVPTGFAHGFQTLLPDCEILYLHTDYHNPELERGYYYNSKDLQIPWPMKVTQISDKDKNLEIFKY